MPKTISPALLAHLQEDTTSLTSCWRITRRDGVVLRFTDHDVDLTVDGELFLAELGYSRTAVDNDLSMAVDNMDVEGFLDSEAITAEDLRAGLYDRATVEVFLANWADPSMGILRLRKGWLGETTCTPEGIFRAELRGLTQALSQKVVEVATPECRADLGDHRCKLPINPDFVVRSQAYSVGQYVRVASIADPYDKIFKCAGAGTTAGAEPGYSNTVGISTVDGTATFTCENAWTRAGVVSPSAVIGSKVVRVIINSPDPRAALDPNWYFGGVFTWITGPNAGRSVEVKAWSDLGGGELEFELFLALPYPFTLTDTFFIPPGCDKRYVATCITKFDNRLNYRGEPFLPGQDFLMQYPDAR